MRLHQLSFVPLQLFNMFILYQANPAHKILKLLQRLVDDFDVCGERNKDGVFIVDCFATALAILLRACQGNITFRVDAHMCDGIILLAGELWLFEGEAVKD